jgi:hypothetical protein
LLRRMGPAPEYENAFFSTELAALDAEAVDLANQIEDGERSIPKHAESRAFESAIASREFVSALRQRLAVVQGEASDIRAELEKMPMRWATSRKTRGAKRGADDVVQAGEGARVHACQGRFVIEWLPAGLARDRGRDK